jgi:hypothetical protein
MSEYINRESIRKVLMDVCSDENCPMFIAATIDQVIDYEPAADVAPVVRCKECEHWGTRKADGYGFCCIWGASVKENSFCSSGVKEDAK